jgi:hypothetical protein
MYKIKNWEMGGKYDPAFTAPEAQEYLIRGEIYNHPDFEDGESVRTASIKSVDGKIITTNSGSEYELENPSEEYVMWCQGAGCHIPTEDEPIKLL